MALKITDLSDREDFKKLNLTEAEIIKLQEDTDTLIQQGASRDTLMQILDGYEDSPRSNELFEFLTTAVYQVVVNSLKS
jgi:antitoxin component of MazEF toxin-antitoxin module